MNHWWRADGGHGWSVLEGICPGAWKTNGNGHPEDTGQN